jgi:hypothetical protein
LYSAQDRVTSLTDPVWTSGDLRDDASFQVFEGAAAFESSGRHALHESRRKRRYATSPLGLTGVASRSGDKGWVDPIVGFVSFTALRSAGRSPTVRTWRMRRGHGSAAQLAGGVITSFPDCLYPFSGRIRDGFPQSPSRVAELPS